MGVSQMSASRALQILRLVWAAMLAAQFSLIFTIVFSRTMLRTQEPASIDPQLLTLIGIGQWVVLTPLGYFIRNQVYKRWWVGSSVKPAAYLAANLILLAMMMAVALLALVNILITRQYWLQSIPFLLALAVQLVNFPSGKPMERNDPHFQTTPH